MPGEVLLPDGEERDDTGREDDRGRDDDDAVEAGGEGALRDVAEPGAGGRWHGLGELAQMAEQAFVAGLDRILLLAALLAFAGAVLSGLLVRPDDFV